MEYVIHCTEMLVVATVILKAALCHPDMFYCHLNNLVQCSASNLAGLTNRRIYFHVSDFKCHPSMVSLFT